MTPEEMAAELRAAGWRVLPPIDQKTCQHPRKTGTGMISSDGASEWRWHCPDCFASGHEKTEAHLNQPIAFLQNYPS